MTRRASCARGSTASTARRPMLKQGSAGVPGSAEAGHEFGHDVVAADVTATDAPTSWSRRAATGPSR